jgi:peptide/nickel transport system substrate-binding protein
MRHLRRSALALVGAALVVLAGCAVQRPAAAPAETDAGPAQRGGTATLLQITEPRTLDPAVLTNAYAGNGVVGNALFGTLVTVDPTDGEVTYGLAEDLTTSDGGTNWTLTLKDGVKFSDGTPLDAAAVKFNWDRIKDPALGSQSARVGNLIASTTATDARTLDFTLTTQLATFADSIAAASLNWIASPAALQAGQQAFDAKPIGAGPFVLAAWTRQDKMEFSRNPSYYDPERPYLDSLTMRTTSDENQRLSTLTAGGGDIMISSNPQAQDRAESAGFVVFREKLNGGNALLYNTAMAPFDDVRARTAVNKAIDLNSVNQAVFAGKGTVPTTLLRPESPLFSDVPLTGYDKEGAQQLFDQLAAEGKPLSFVMTSYQTNESRIVVESIQAQLSAYRNVSAQVEILDFAGAGGKTASRQFQAIIGSPGIFGDPGFPLWNNLATGSAANVTQTSDPELDAALTTGRTTTDVQTRLAAYRTVQERVGELVPFLLYTRSGAAVINAADVHGIATYGSTSLLPEQLWKESS